MKKKEDRHPEVKVEEQQPLKLALPESSRVDPSSETRVLSQPTRFSQSEPSHESERQYEDDDTRYGIGGDAMLSGLERPYFQGKERQTEPDRLVENTIGERYRIMELLGSGGMSAVYRGIDITSDKAVAVKVLLPSRTSDRQSVLRFRQEVKAASRLNHRGIVAIHDFNVTESGQPYLVMDLVEGESLADLLADRRVLDVHTTIAILDQACTALNHAHENGVVHRDLKPSNIMLSTGADGELIVKLVDFGIAKILGGDRKRSINLSLTQAGEIFGSPLYMSPEQGVGKKVDHRSDIYSLGCVAYECLTGLPPHLGNTPMETLVLHQTKTPLSLREASLGQKFPEALEKIVAKMLSTAPSARYQSAAQLRKDIEDFKEGRVDVARFEKVELNERWRESITEHDKRADLKRSSQAALQKMALKTGHNARLTSDLSLLGVVFIVVLMLLLSFSYLTATITTPPPMPVKSQLSGSYSINSSDLVGEPTRTDDFIGDESRHRSTFYITGPVKPSDWDSLKSAEYIDHVSFLGSNLNDASLSILQRLPIESLSFANCQRITNDGFAKLASMKTLKRLSLKYVHAGDEMLGKLPPSLTQVEIQHSLITGKGVGDLARLPNLKDLNLSYNRNLNKSQLEFGSFKSLISLTIDSDQLTRSSADSLSRMRLPVLILTRPANMNEMTRDECSVIGRIKSLVFLDASSCDVSHECAYLLRKALPSTVIKVREARN